MNRNSANKEPALRNSFKPPLITPSASPPPWTSTSISGRHPDTGLPPLKRSRASATPHPTSFFMSSTTAGHEPGTDFHKERQASAMRLLDVWSNLAERYTRRLDEDDIVDLRTLEIVTDNGVMRGIGKVDFGSISEVQEGNRDNEGEGEDEEEDNEDEGDVDELDTITRVDSDCYELEALETQIHARTMPLVSSLNPVDAEDLKEFMEAEKRRKELCGSEPEDEIEHTVDVSEMNQSSHDRGDSSAHATDIEDAEDTEGDELSDSGSDDELVNNWGADAASAVYEVTKPDENASEDDSDIEIVEGPIYKPEKLKNPGRRSITEVNLQLQTPPKSSSCVPSGSSPRSGFFSSLPPSSPPPRSLSPFEVRESSPTPPTSPAILSSSPLRSPHVGLQGPNPAKSGLPPKNNRSTDSSKLLPNTIHFQVNSHSTTQVSKPTKNAEAGPSTYRPHTKTLDRGVKAVHSHSELGFRAAQSLKPTMNAEAGPSTHRVSAKMPVRSAKNLHSEADHHNINPVLKLTKNAEAGPLTNSTRAKTPSRAMKVMHSEKDYQKDTPKHTANTEAAVINVHMRAKTLTRASVKPEVVIEIRKPFSPSKVEREDSSEFEDLPPPPPKISRSTPSVQKRKRISTSSESGDSPPKPRYSGAKRGEGKTMNYHRKGTSKNGSSSGSERDSYEKKRSTRGRSKSKSLHISSDSEESEASSSGEYSQPRHPRSPQATFNPTPPYPYMQPPSTQHHPHHYPPQVYPPIPDPRAQIIVAHAMQQLSALVGWGTSPGIPFTPSRRHGHSSPGLMYSTPTHHVFPYMFDPNMSNATLPPDSPNLQSSPDIAPRKKSLVRRSRSRGRRVSFKVDNRDDGDLIDVQSSPIRPSLARKQMERAASRGKGKAKAKTASDAERTSDEGELSELEIRETRIRSHGRRGQTPGPASDGERSRKQPRRGRKSMSVDAR
ncbi:hypothetical protein BDQ17DRAFT_1343349 [Cyathus striatus]|nr:hypothetical protein BDQ17DRAFT_1343349 [Cyathus striatus]